MTVKTRIEIALLLPALPDARDACVVLHEGSTLLVVLNALRLLAYQEPG